MGHEAAGTVVGAGRAVKGFKPGNRIAAHPVHPCGKCSSCRSGVAHLCVNMAHFGLNIQGTCAEYFVVREDRARIIPDSVDFPVAALMEPVCVCLEALHQARLSEADTLLVVGDGPFGIIISLLASHRNLSKVVLAGHHDSRLSFTRGAVTTINTGKLDDPMQHIMQHVDHIGYDAVILAAGNQQAVKDGLELLRAKGRLVLFSAVTGQTPLDLFKVQLKELEIVGSCNDNNMIDQAAIFLSDKELGLDRLITHKFSIGQYEKVFALAESGKDLAIKVAFIFEEKCL